MVGYRKNVLRWAWALPCRPSRPATFSFFDISNFWYVCQSLVFTSETTNMKMKCKIQIFTFRFRVRVKRMDAWTPKIKHPGYFRKDLNFCILKNIITEYQKSWMFHWMFSNLRFLQSKFSLFDYRSTSKRQIFANLRFFAIQVFIFDYRSKSESGIYKSWRKKPAISTISKTFEMFSTWPVSKYTLMKSPHSKFQVFWLKNYAINFLSLPYVYFDVSSLWRQNDVIHVHGNLITFNSGPKNSPLFKIWAWSSNCHANNSSFFFFFHPKNDVTLKRLP